MSRMLSAAALCAVLLGAVPLGATACSDDGTKVRIDQTAAAGAGSGSLNEQDLGGPAKTRQLQAAVDSYRSYVLAETATMRTATTAFTDAVRAGNVALARDLYAPSRYGWETIEPIAALVPGVDAQVDGRVSDFSGPEDPLFGGWHRLEYLLWVKGSTAGAAPFADKLDTDLANLETALAKVAITPKAMVLGARALVSEVAQRKVSGEEDRYSHTDLWDFAANLDGAQSVFRTLTPVLRAKDNVLYNSLLRGFGSAVATLTRYRSPSGAYKPYTVVPAADRQRITAQFGALAADLAKVVTALEL
jgi:iron uptake system component EfeO